MEKQAKRELVVALRRRFQESVRGAKTRILDEFVAVTGYHRKYALRLLRGDWNDARVSKPPSWRIYDEAVKEALIVLWEAGDRICGKRLKAILPELLVSLENHGHLHPDVAVRNRLLSISASSIDRLLRPVRSAVGQRKHRRVVRKVRSRVAVRTFSEWDEVVPGNLEIDFVAHCGKTLAGSFIHSLVATDVATGWTETLPLIAREQSLVVAGLNQLRLQFPIPILSINSDNDSAFINDSLINFCAAENIAFTRSRPYRKNDQAWIEQKNGAIVRRFVGYARYSGPVAGQAIAHLYAYLRLFINYFQPSFKLLKKERNGAKVKKSYSEPMTPCDRVLSHTETIEQTKESLRSQRGKLDPIRLLHEIRRAQGALAAIASDEPSTSEMERDLDTFLAQLPRLWEQGEVRPTHQLTPTKERDWRTRKDPFEGVWSTVLAWLEREPELTARSILDRLASDHPEVSSTKHLRTLQRRVRQWRHVLAKQLVFGTTSR